MAGVTDKDVIAGLADAGFKPASKEPKEQPIVEPKIESGSDPKPEPKVDHTPKPEPKVETKVEPDKKVLPEIKPDEIKPIADIPKSQELAEEEYFKWLEKVSNGRLKGKADLDDLPNLIKPANGRLAKANEYALLNEGDELAFYKTQSTDWSKVDAADIIKSNIKKDNPSLTDTQVNKVIEKKYSLYPEDHDKYDEEEAELGKIQLEMDANPIRKAFIQEQETLAVHPAQKERQTAAENEARQKQENDKVIETWKSGVKNHLKDFKSITLDLGDGKPFNYEIKDATDVEALEQQLTNISGISHLLQSDRYKGEDGLKKLAEDVYFVNNRDKIIKTLVESKKNASTEAFVDTKLKGVPTKTSQGGSPGPKGTVTEQLQRKMGFTKA